MDYDPDSVRFNIGVENRGCEVLSAQELGLICDCVTTYQEYYDFPVTDKLLQSPRNFANAATFRRPLKEVNCLINKS